MGFNWAILELSGTPGDFKLNKGALLAYEMDWFETGARRKRWEDTSRSKSQHESPAGQVTVMYYKLAAVRLHLYFNTKKKKEKKVPFFYYL